MTFRRAYGMDQPNALGEALREVFFDMSDGSFGCYSTFDLAEGVVPLPESPVCEGHAEHTDDECWEGSRMWTRAEKDFSEGRVEMRYYWDGYGVLEFIFGDGTILANGDCKKSHYWGTPYER